MGPLLCVVEGKDLLPPKSYQNSVPNLAALE